jgi:trk system potassium uptake protein TrkH
MGILSKAFLQDIRRMISPESAITSQKYHHIREVWLDDGLVRTAMTITVAYLALYGIGSVIGVLCGYPLDQAAFEMVSAASNTGLSCGVTTSTMPAVLKVTYLLGMWLGRLEFMSIFALFGYLWSVVRGR